MLPRQYIPQKAQSLYQRPHQKRHHKEKASQARDPAPGPACISCSCQCQLLPHDRSKRQKIPGYRDRKQQQKQDIGTDSVENRHPDIPCGTDPQVTEIILPRQTVGQIDLIQILLQLRNRTLQAILQAELISRIDSRLGRSQGPGSGLCQFFKDPAFQPGILWQQNPYRRIAPLHDPLNQTLRQIHYRIQTAILQSLKTFFPFQILKIT